MPSSVALMRGIDDLQEQEKENDRNTPDVDEPLKAFQRMVVFGCVKDAIASMESELRQVIHLRLDIGDTPVESAAAVAIRLGISVSQVNRRSARALLELRTRLQHYHAIRVIWEDMS